MARRTFRLGPTVLPDPDPDMTPEEVRDYYAGAGYPELTTCAIEVADAEVTFQKPGKAIARTSSKTAQDVNFVPSQGKRG